MSLEIRKSVCLPPSMVKDHIYVFVCVFLPFPDQNCFYRLLFEIKDVKDILSPYKYFSKKKNVFACTTAIKCKVLLALSYFGYIFLFLAEKYLLHAVLNDKILVLDLTLYRNQIYLVRDSLRDQPRCEDICYFKCILKGPSVTCRALRGS